MKVYAAPSHIELPSLDFRDIPAYEKASADYLSAVQDWARENSAPHALAGEVVSTPYADGQAVYVVAKLEGSVALIHIGTWDAWRSPLFERTATVKYLREIAARRNARAVLDERVAAAKLTPAPASA